MRVALPLLISTAMAAAMLLEAAPATASTTATATNASISVVAKAKKSPKKKAPRRGSLRVTITGAPEGRVKIKGPKLKVSLTTSSILNVRTGRYSVRALKFSVAGDSYLPDGRNWKLRVRKGSQTRLTVKYVRSGSSSHGSVGTDSPPAGSLGEIFVLVNQARSQSRQCGDRTMPAVDPVTYDDELGSAAQGHAADMNAQDYFEHDSLDGRTFADRIRDAHYTGSPAGENIAMGFQIPSDVVQGWLDSPGHCINVMDADFDEMGLGFASHADARYSVPVTYWVQDFGYTD